LAQPDRIDDGIALVKDELMSLVTHIHGCMGLSLLVDRASGRYIATSSWESEEAMRASDNNDQLQPVRQRLLDTLGAESLDVQEWEIAIFHRHHESPAGACAQVTWARPQSGRLDAAVDAFKTDVLPLFEINTGFCSASVLINRETGLLCSTLGFDSWTTAQANRESSAEQQARMAERAGIEFVDVLECEIPFHHLRVGEQV
jgi:quinol monooxygenase YgiN